VDVGGDLHCWGRDYDSVDVIEWKRDAMCCYLSMSCSDRKTSGFFSDCIVIGVFGLIEGKNSREKEQ
jgi:hypothetical protein